MFLATRKFAPQNNESGLRTSPGGRTTVLRNSVNEAGLVQELRRLCEHMKPLGLMVALDTSEADGCATTEEEDLFAYEIAREFLLNVLRHAGADRAELVLQATSRREIAVTVRDAGVGFDPGMWLSTGAERRGGLSTLHDRLEGRGGGLSIVSLLGKGTVATALFPLQQPQPEPVSPAPPASARPAASCRDEKSSRDYASVLIVDDHPWVREAIASLLAQHEDVRIVGEAATGEEAIEAVRSCRPDLVVLDLYLPGLSGIAVTKRIVQECPSAKVLGLSIQADEGTIDTLKTAGAAGFLSKHQLVEDLYRTLKAFVSTPTPRPLFDD